jgi:terminase small subunit-like protein
MVATVKTKERRKRGRPCGYNDEIVDKILGRIGDGESLRAVCADKGMPNRATVFRWIARYAEFRDLYGFARECRRWLQLANLAR